MRAYQASAERNSMIELYGITNCDTVKKARNWLAENNIVYEFSDFKKNAPSEAVIRQWLEQVPLEILLNKRGTTWRKLDDADRQAAENNLDEAVQLMAENPSLIKRPVLRKEGRVYVGFSVENYQKIFFGIKRRLKDAESLKKRYNARLPLTITPSNQYVPYR